MTDTSAALAATPRSAGALLRAARLAQGLHIGALAAQVKVPAARLEALEADRFEQLPDTTFTRALAKTLCRVLKTDPVPILALLPGAPGALLDRVDGGLNTPFNDRPGRTDPAQWVPWRRPVPWAVGALLVAAAAFVLVPMRGDLLAPAPAAHTPLLPPEGEVAPTAIAPPVAGTAPTAAVAPLPAAASAPPGTVVPAPGAPPLANVPGVIAGAAAAASAPPAGADDKVVLRALKDTWVQASDASGQTLLSRLVPAGETVEFTGVLPLKVRVGNVAGTELQFRGQPVPLKLSRENVATVTLP